MNVATTTATPTLPAKGDPTAATTTRAVLGPDDGSIDRPADGAATQDDTFGRLLSRGLAGADDGLPGSGPTNDTGLLPGDPSLDPAARAVGFGVAAGDSGLVQPGPGRTKAIGDAADEVLPTAGGASRDDAAANDLAAQLALVSQWAGLAKASPAADANAGAGPDLRDKLAAVRGTAGPASRGASPAIGATVQDDASLAGAAGNRAPFGPDGRGTDLAPPSIAPVKAEPVFSGKPEAGATRAADLARTSAELSALSGEPGAGRTTSDAAATNGAFAQQVAAAVSTASGIGPQPAGASAVPTWNLHEQVGTPAWSREVGQATLRIATNDLQGASLQINPEHLGPVDVQVRIDNGIAHLSFAAAHADTRQAIESSRATLDRLFADQGLKIGDCAVGDGSASRRGFDADAGQGSASQRDGTGRWDAAGRGFASADGGTTAATVTTRLKALGLVDTFA